MKKVYAGIGSRKTPPHVLAAMTELAKVLTDHGYILRSGGAEGADLAFEQGAGAKEIFLPWRGFNENNSPFCEPSQEAAQIAAKYHPAWFGLKHSVRKLMARNTHQVLGDRCDDPVDFLICYTPKGTSTGGTGQAIRIAKDYRIPVIDLGHFEQSSTKAIVSLALDSIARQPKTLSANPMSRVYRTPWKDFPDVIVQTTIAKLKAHRDYDAAKAGDPQSGIRVVSDLLKPGKVTFKIDAIVPVLQFDANKRNAIPFSYAALLGNQLRVPVSANVLQINQVSHTGAGAFSRILGQPLFDGNIERGMRVLLVDDVVTYGSTLANLRGWLEHQGVKVIGSTCVAAAFGSTKLAPPAEVIERLLSRFPSDVNQLADNLGFEAGTFTNREARYLAEIKTLETFQALVQASAKIQEMNRSLLGENKLDQSREQER